LEELITALQNLPGVGPRSAQRMAESILRMDYELARELARSIVRAKKNVRSCSICFNHTEQDPCAICADTERDRSFICVVEASEDVVAFERSKAHTGVYHVLGGTINPTKGIGPERIRLKELADRAAKGGIKEILIATNPTLEGETTAAYIMKQLSASGALLTRPARGLPRGADLDYLDSDTISHAYQARQEIKQEEE
jgi:recombination protein RecR